MVKKRNKCASWFLMPLTGAGVINKIGRPSSGSLIRLVTSMITDQIGQHKVLSPINHTVEATGIAALHACFMRGIHHIACKFHEKNTRKTLV